MTYPQNSCPVDVCQKTFLSISTPRHLWGFYCLAVDLDYGTISCSLSPGQLVNRPPGISSTWRANVCIVQPAQGIPAAKGQLRGTHCSICDSGRGSMPAKDREYLAKAYLTTTINSNVGAHQKGLVFWGTVPREDYSQCSKRATGSPARPGCEMQFVKRLL